MSGAESALRRVDHFRAPRRFTPKEAADKLAPGRFKPPNYPLEALAGPRGLLAAAAREISDRAQVAPPMAGQAVLSAAALCVQGVVDVATVGGRKPTSEFFLTIAASGDGKSTADSIAGKGVQLFEHDAAQAYREQRQAAIDEDASGIRQPWVLVGDGTVEGLRRSFVEGRPAQGLFTAEAGALLGGHGMTRENRAKTAATFNSLWDGSPISVARAGAERVQLYDRRLSAHLLVQPLAARETLADPLLDSIGFWPRFLVAWPEDSPPRKWQRMNLEESEPLEQFWRRCAELLAMHPSDECSNLTRLEFEPDAETYVGNFFERMEVEAKRGELREIRPFALRATEHLARVAAIVAAFDGADRIDLATVENAARLVAYSLDCWRGIFGSRREGEVTDNACKLFVWMERKGGEVSEAAILRLGPRATRGRASRDEALALLELHGLIEPAGRGYWAIAEAPCDE